MTPLNVVVVGAGHRGIRYARYATRNPERMRIVGVVDPDPLRRRDIANEHQLPETAQFASISEFLAAGSNATAAINATMDNLHVGTSIPLLEAGLDVLLEKPIATSSEDMLTLQAAAQRTGRTVMVCHVLRFAPFYSEIKKRLVAGEIGDLINIQLSEHVSYHHMAVGYVRGKWNDQAKAGSSMLMAKSCHDLDLLSWFKSGVSPTRVSSAGSRMYFRPENAPAGSGTRCLTDCAIEATCPHSARKHYIDMGLWDFYAWTDLEHLGRPPTRAEMEESLAGDNPFGRCVWRCDNTVVDHQSVLVEFTDGATATHNMVGNSAKPCRAVRMIGTKREIDGVLEDGTFAVRQFDVTAPDGYREEIVGVDVKGAMHGGGDLRLVEDFVAVLGGGEPSLSTTDLEDSINGHLIGFGADEAMASGEWMELATSRR